jgi:hypothetical protein
MIKMKHLDDRLIGLEEETVEDRTEQIGRDPRNMTDEELIALGHQKMPVLKAIRARCIDCCSNQIAEVRKCVAVACPSWPYRMGTNPWRDKKEMNEEHKEKLKDALAKARAAKIWG